jgi:ankyrin repeat protein
LMATCESGHLKIARFLVERAGGANVNAAMASGQTALMWASQNGHFEIARCLLEHGANADAVRALCGRTPLMFASKHGYFAIVRLLLERGASRHLLCHAGRTALDYAASHPLVLAALA